jgi:hypothetical protein
VKVPLDALSELMLQDLSNLKKRKFDNAGNRQCILRTPPFTTLAAHLTPLKESF